VEKSFGNSKLQTPSKPNFKEKIPPREFDEEFTGRKYHQRNVDLESLSPGLDFFQIYLYRIPGNGKKTLIWKDNIMGHPPLENSEEIKEIREWLTQRDFIKLADISSWDATGNWWAWELPEIPAHLQNQKTLLINSLSIWLLSTCARQTNGDGERTGRYTAAQGYNSLQSLQAMTESTSLWKQVGQLKNLHVCVCVCSCTYHSLIQRLVQCSSSSKPKPRKTLANTKELQQASITLACPPREDVSSPLLDEYNLRFNHKTLALMSKG
jgi:hypothetical protein